MKNYQQNKYYPENALKIFISSNCEDEKFIKVRRELKIIFHCETNKVFMFMKGQ